MNDIDPFIFIGDYELAQEKFLSILRHIQGDSSLIIPHIEIHLKGSTYLKRTRSISVVNMGSWSLRHTLRKVSRIKHMQLIFYVQTSKNKKSGSESLIRLEKALRGRDDCNLEALKHTTGVLIIIYQRAS